jgi:Icc-related predicted phosphoesterase
VAGPRPGRIASIRLETRHEVDELVRAARADGAYGFVTTRDEIAEIQSSIEREREVFRRLKIAALEEWLALADERLASRRVQAYVMPGNDDPAEIDPVLGASRSIRDVQGP